MFNHVHIACLCVVSAEIRRGLSIPVSGITGSYELSSVSLGNWAWVLCRSRKYSEPSHLFGPALMFLLIQYIVVLLFSIYKHKSTKHVCS